MKTDKQKSMIAAQAELDRRREEQRRDVPPGIEQEIAERNLTKCGRIPLLRAIAAVQAEMPILRKTETAVVPTKSGREYQYKYVSLKDIWAVLQPLLSKNGLIVTNMLNNGELKTYVWHVETGESVFSGYPVDMKLAPQALGSELTYARRYNLNSIFQIVADEDDDGAAAMDAARRTGSVSASLNF